MNPALTIARLIGPLFRAIGIGMLANGSTYRQMGGQFLAGYPTSYLSGVLAMVAGLAILNTHNAWTRDWRSVLTALGWILSLVGVYRIVAPQFVNFVGTAVLAHSGFFIRAGFVLLARGGFLTFKGYAA